MSSAFQYLVDLVRQDGLTLLLGTTLLLTMFALLVRYSRSLSTKNLLASTAMLAVLGYLVVAIVPMPRFGIDLRGATTPDTSAAEQTPSNQPTPPAPQRSPIASNEHMFAVLPPTNADQPNAIVAANSAPPSMPSRGERLASSLVTPELSQPVASTFDLSMWLAGALASGAMIFALHLLIGWLHLRRLLSKSQHAPAELTRLVKLPARTRLRIVNAAVQPFCCGLLRPTIVLPQRLARPTDETRFILLHERAHLTSGDTRARLLAALLRPLLFWHPLYWWLQKKLRFTSELLADDAAAQGSVAEYVRCMMTLSTHPDPAAGGALVATIFHRRSELFRRLEMMLQRNEAISRSHSPLSRWTRAASTIVLIALCAGTFGVEDAVAQSPRNGQVNTQVRELRAELDRLRREITALRRSESRVPLHNVKVGRRNEEPGEVAVVPTAKAQDPITAPRTATNRRVLYKVKKGDTLERIAKKVTGSSRGVQEILRSNPNVEPNRLRVGQQLTIPLKTASTLTRKNDQSPSAPRAPRSLGRNSQRGDARTGRGRSDANGRAPRALRSERGSRLSTGRRGASANTQAPKAAVAQDPVKHGHAGASAPSVGRRAKVTGLTSGGTSSRGRSASGLSSSGPSAGSTRARGPSVSGPGVSGPSVRGPGASGPSVTGPSRRGPSGGGNSTTSSSRRSPRSPSHPRATGAQPAAVGTTTTTSSLVRAQHPSNTARQTSTSSLSGLADVITRCLELRGDVEIQEVNLRHASSEKEREIAQIRLRTKQSQFQAIRAMIKQELAAAEQAHAHAKTLHKRGFVTASEVQATESKMVLLARALK